MIPVGYGVVVCPDCRRAKAYEEGTKSTTCAHCGRRLDVTTLRTFFRTDEGEALRKAVGRINARLAGEPEVLEGVEGEGDDPFGGPGPMPGELEAFDRSQEGDEAEPAPPAGPSASRSTAGRGSGGDERSRVEATARELARVHGDEGFGRTAFEEALEDADLDPGRTDRYLSYLVEEGLVYEPRPGRFKML